MARIFALTLNIAHARGPSGHQLLKNTPSVRQNLDRIADLITRSNADVVALQEVDFGSFWNGNFNHLQYLAQRSGLSHAAAGLHMDRYRLRYGTALLSRWKLSEQTNIRLPSSALLPPKGMVHARSHLPRANNGDFQIASLHLDFARSAQRNNQVKLLRDKLQKVDRPMILMGDFNAEWGDKHSAVEKTARMLNLSTHEGLGAGLVTFPTTGRCWDWILYSSEFKLISYETIDGRISDHRAVLACLELDFDQVE